MKIQARGVHHARPENQTVPDEPPAALVLTDPECHQMMTHTAPVRTTPARAGRRAFTIIEVMIVLVILGVIGGIVAINLVGAAKQARIDATELSMKTVVGGLKAYRARETNYPATETWKDDLRNLIASNDLTDAWGNEFIYYRVGEGGFELWSNGPDQLPDTEDDIPMGPDHE